MMNRLAVFCHIFGAFYLTHFAFSRVLNYPEECKKLCDIAGIKNRECTPEEKALLQAAYEAKQQAEKERDRADNQRNQATRDLLAAQANATRLEIERNSAVGDLNRVKIPVLVRNIRDRIEEKWSRPSKCEKCLEYDHATSDCKAPKTTNRSKEDKEEKLRDTVRYWDYLTTEHPDDLDFILLMNELHSAYESTTMFKKFSFTRYKKTFFRCLGVACEITDGKVDIDFVIRRMKCLNVFGCPIDEFMTPLVRALGYLVDADLPVIIYSEEEITEATHSTDLNGQKAGPSPLDTLL